MKGRGGEGREGRKEGLRLRGAGFVGRAQLLRLVLLLLLATHPHTKRPRDARRKTMA